MLIHITKNNESINSISKQYNIEKEQVTTVNGHIKDWKSLCGGLKIKIPIINKEVRDEIEEYEPFLQDYYDEPIEEIELNTETKEIENKQNKESNYIDKEVMSNDNYVYPSYPYNDQYNYIQYNQFLPYYPVMDQDTYEDYYFNYLYQNTLLY